MATPPGSPSPIGAPEDWLIELAEAREVGPLPEGAAVRALNKGEEKRKKTQEEKKAGKARKTLETAEQEARSPKPPFASTGPSGT